MSDAFVHLRVPAGTKARWVRESRAAGMRLTEWLVQRVEAGGMRAVHPGEVLREDYQTPAGLTVEQLAARLGLPAQEVSVLLEGAAPITSDMAGRIVATFGGDLQSWLELQAQFDRKSGNAATA